MSGASGCIENCRKHKNGVVFQQSASLAKKNCVLWEEKLFLSVLVRESICEYDLIDANRVI